MKVPTLGFPLELKNPDPNGLRGRLIAFVRILKEDSDINSPLGGMVQGGLLSVQANYVEQRSIKDFFKAEFGVSLQKGIEEVIEQAKATGGLEGALDPEAVKERLESMKNAEFIPIPAKVAHFSSEEEMLGQNADVYYLGAFHSINHAHLCVNSFPIMYQAQFREQEQRHLEEEILGLLSGIESGKSANSPKNSIGSFEGDVKKHLLKELIPDMIYSLGDSNDYQKALSRFREFMVDFSHPEDIQEIINLVESDLRNDERKLHKLELVVCKVVALLNENWVELEKIKKELSELM